MMHIVVKRLDNDGDLEDFITIDPKHAYEIQFTQPDGHVVSVCNLDGNVVKLRGKSGVLQAYWDGGNSVSIQACDWDVLINHMKDNISALKRRNNIKQRTVKKQSNRRQSKLGQRRKI